MIDIPHCKRKLREAEFFLAALPHSSGEQFHFYLSAFLNAARSVTWVLQKEQKSAYDEFFPRWQRQLPASDRDLLDFMNDRRVEEAKMTGASHTTYLVPVPVFTLDRGESDSPEISTSILTGRVSLCMPDGTVFETLHCFELANQTTAVTEVCSRYCALLKCLVDDFRNKCAEHSGG